MPGPLSVFPNPIFFHNNTSILRKPEGKEKQDRLEYNVSRTTALQLYRGPSKPEPGRQCCRGPGETCWQHRRHNYRRGGKHKQNTLPVKCSTSLILRIKQHRKSSREDSKKKTTDVWSWQRSKPRESWTTSPPLTQGRNAIWNSKKKLQHHWCLTVRWGFP